MREQKSVEFIFLPPPRPPAPVCCSFQKKVFFHKSPFSSNYRISQVYGGNGCEHMTIVTEEGGRLLNCGINCACVFFSPSSCAVDIASVRRAKGKRRRSRLRLRKRLMLRTVLETGSVFLSLARVFFRVCRDCLFVAKKADSHFSLLIIVKFLFCFLPIVFFVPILSFCFCYFAFSC